KTASLPPAATTSVALSSAVPIPDPADYPFQRRSDPTRPDSPLRVVPKPPPSTPLARPPVTPAAVGAAAQPILWRRPDGTEFRIVGQSHELFVLVEVEGELWVIDQHAAHERVIYEQVLATLHSQQGESQPLLLPLTFELPAAARAALEEVQ